MTRLDDDLEQIEKQVLTWTRTPLNRSTPLEDLEGRIHSLEVGQWPVGSWKKKQPWPGAVFTLGRNKTRQVSCSHGI
jgi:hypothetical protein